MAINVSQAFKRTSANPIDETLTLTKAQMLTVNDNLMPNKYLTVCQDDGAIYLYDKSATPSAETGKFTKFEGGGGQGGSGITIDATLLASGWNSGTKQQTVTFTGYESTMGGVIGVPASATTAQKGEYATAKINVISVSGTSFTFECDEIPSIDLPVTLYAGGSGGGGGADLPSGGTTGQALVKASDADNDVEWGDVSGEQIQYEEMPQADITNLGQIVQYIGITDTDYTNGLFYKCVSDGESTPTYSWAIKDVQTYPEVDLTNVFASGMPVASVTVPMVSYRTEEQVVGTWIDGKPIYQKTLTGNLSSMSSDINTSTEIDVSSLSIEELVDVRGMLTADNGSNTYGKSIVGTARWMGSGASAIETSYMSSIIYNYNNVSGTLHRITINVYDKRFSNQPYKLTIQYTKTTD